MNKKKVLITALILIILFITGSLIISYRVFVQNEVMDELRGRLEDQNIHVILLEPVERAPFVVNIVIGSESETDDVTPDDIWNKLLVYRECSQAYASGVSIDSYRLEIQNVAGKNMYEESNYFTSQDRSPGQVTESAPKLTALQVEEQVRSRIVTNGFETDTLSIIDYPSKDGSTRILQMQFTAPDNDANAGIATLLSSLDEALDQMDKESGVDIDLCRMRVVDTDGSVILTYVRDLKFGGKSVKWNGLDLSGYIHAPKAQDELDQERLTTETPQPYPYPAPIQDGSGGPTPYP